MTSLNIVRVLDALERASMEQSKKGQTDGWVQWGVLVKRLIVEYPALKETSVPVQTSRYLKQAETDGYVEKEKRGRKTFYKITPEGHVYLLGRRDQLSENFTPWYERGVKHGYMSYAVAPTGSPIIIEDKQDTINGVEVIDELMKKIKEQNPGLRSLYLRFE